MNLLSKVAAGKGILISKGEEIAGAAAITQEDNILLIGKSTSICVAATELPLLSRTSQGNIISRDEVQSIIKL